MQHDEEFEKNIVASIIRSFLEAGGKRCIGRWGLRARWIPLVQDGHAWSS